jgi:hypothetical protein
VAIRYACLECGISLINQPTHYALDEKGHHTPVMVCPTCNRFYRRHDKTGDLVETEAFELED